MTANRPAVAGVFDWRYGVLFTALLGEYVHPRLAAYLLIPAVALGAGSVFY
jgi:hypothetical protein